MRILVLIKGVSDGDGGWTINHGDKIVLEAALLKKDAWPKETRVELLCYGGEDCRRALRLGLAAGADRAYLVKRNGGDPEGGWTDPFETARALSAGIAKLRRLQADWFYDIILCGNRSQDLGAGAVGCMTAELLGIPQVTAMTSFEWEEENAAGTGGRRITVLRSAEGRREEVETFAPCLISGSPGRDTLRGVSFMDIQQAFEKELLTLEWTEGTQEEKKTELWAAAPIRQKRLRRIGTLAADDEEVRREIVAHLVSCRYGG